MVDSIHKMHAHILISVWARFDLDTANGKELEKAGALYPPVIPNVYPKGQGKWYDAFNAEGAASTGNRFGTARHDGHGRLVAGRH